jgi:hypothetical protein
MTLEPYGPGRLDDMSLRMLDICSEIRQISVRCRQEQIETLGINDKKALEWLGKLEHWLGKVRAESDRAITRNRARKRAQEAAARKW